MAKLGRLGTYETTTLVEIPQRFVKNDVTKKLIKPGTLLIVPNVDNKFCKFVDVGETEIVEVTEKADRADDFMTYEVQREMGIACIFDRYFGVLDYCLNKIEVVRGWYNPTSYFYGTKGL